MVREYLLQALGLAQTRQGFCAPNPAVGAVLSGPDGEVWGVGTHFAAGHAHAEVVALSKAKDRDLSKATLYVTLEPCAHFGKTPPCTQAILNSGVGNVVYAYSDPNPKVDGQGAAVLAAKGVSVQHCALGEIDRFYEPYSHWLQTGRPFVTTKLALSLDGKTAGARGKRLAITSADANHLTHQRRLNADGILTTARTIMFDDPQLNVRLSPQAVAKKVFVLDRLATTPCSAQVFQTAEKVTIFHGIEAEDVRLLALKEAGAQLVALSPVKGGIDVNRVLDWLGREGIHSLWVEAGGETFRRLAESGNVQTSLLYVAPLWLGPSASPAFGSLKEDIFRKAQQVHWIPCGRDTVCEIQW